MHSGHIVSISDLPFLHLFIEDFYHQDAQAIFAPGVVVPRQRKIANLLVAFDHPRNLQEIEIRLYRYSQVGAELGGSSERIT